MTVRTRLIAIMRSALAECGRQYVTGDEARRIAMSDELPAVLLWLARSDAPRPRILGTPHVVGVIGDRCIHCHAVCGGLARTYGLQRFVLGDQFGTDCRPPKEAEHGAQPGQVVQHQKHRPRRRRPRGRVRQRPRLPA